MGVNGAGPGKFRRTVGYALLAVSMLAWPATLALPFFDVTLAEGAAIATSIVVGAQVLFLIGLALVGRDLWQRLVTLVRARIEKQKQP